MSVNLDQVQMRQAIDEAGCRHLANATKIIDVDLIDVATSKLLRTGRHAVEHLIGAVEVMDRAENEIEFVPVLFHPASAGGGSLWIVIELDPRANFHVGISRAQFFDLIEINSGVIAIVIGECDVAQSNTRARDQPTVATASAYKAAPDVPADACDNRKRDARRYFAVTAPSKISAGCAGLDIPGKKHRR